MIISVLQQPGDGSCFFHSILAGADPDFFNMNRKKRKEVLTNVRNFLSDIFDFELVPNYFLNNLIIELQSEYLNDGINTLFKKKNNS